MKKENTKKFIVVAVILILAVLLIVMIVVIWRLKVMGQSPANLVVDSGATSEESGDPLASLADRQVYFAGMEDQMIGKDTIVELSNLPENEEILMSYEILDADTGESLHRTDLIPSGTHTSWIPGETLNTGTYHLIFHQMPYLPYPDSDSGYLPLTNANNEVTFTIIGEESS